MATVQTSTEQRLLLHDVSWQSYDLLLRALDERPLRLTYDRGALEIMTLSHRHERRGHVIARFIETLTEELDVPIHGGKSTTLRKEEAERGLEPDESYWIQNEPSRRGRDEFDPETDPPPDLVLEIDITSSSLDRMSIYASLGVSEVWRLHRGAMRIYRLVRGGRYVECDYSPTFPSLPLDELARFLQESHTENETTLIRSFRAWVRENLLPTWKGVGHPEDKPGKGRRKK